MPRMLCTQHDLIRAVHACTDIDGDNTATGTYELNTTELSGCTGGTFVISAVFYDSSELIGDSTGTVTLIVQPNCPPVRPCDRHPLCSRHACRGHIAAHMLTPHAMVYAS